MRFAPDFIEKVRDANNIAEIISQHTELRGGGGRLMGRCPYPDHLDKSPSFSVDETRQLFHCFGCKKGGDIFNFLETYDGIAFPEAVEKLARRASIPLPEPEPGQRRPGAASHESKELFYRLNREAAVFWHRQLKGLPEGDAILGYLEKRGLTREIIETFRIGASSAEWEDLVKHLEARKAPLVAAETLGLVRSRKTKSGYFDLFRERIMFPIFSPSGEVVGFGGRTYADGTPKYLNSPESPAFSKSRTLYALNETGKFIRSRDEAIVVEGYMDAVALYGAGIKNVVAILGTAFTADHAKILKRYSMTVKMLLDGDDAGMNAAERALPILLQAGLHAKGFFLPEKLDPDDYVRVHGADALRAELDRAPDLFSLILNRHMRGYGGTASEKVRVMEDLAPSFRAAANPQLLDLYFLELSQRLDVSLEWVRKTAQNLIKDQRPTRNKTDGEPAPAAAQPAPLTEAAREIVSLKGAPRDEAFVLSLALHNETLFKTVLASDFAVNATHDGVKRLLQLAVERYGQKPTEFARLAAYLSSYTDQPHTLSKSIEFVRTSRGAVAENASESENANAEEEAEQLVKVLSDYMTAIRRRQLKNQAKALANQLRYDTGAPVGEESATNGGPESVADKLEQIMNLVRNRHSLDRE